MRGDQLARQWGIIREIEVSPKGLDAGRNFFYDERILKVTLHKPRRKLIHKGPSFYAKVQFCVEEACRANSIANKVINWDF